jgi:hypothetical protein
MSAHDRQKLQVDQLSKQTQINVQAAQYEVDRAFEQYDLVDPKNRLVADTLEQRLNDKLAELSSARQKLDALREELKPLTLDQQKKLEQLGSDFPKIWHHPNTPVELKKRLLRTVLTEVVVSVDPDSFQLEVIMHWQGGAHTRLYVKKRATPIGSKTDKSLIKTIRSLAQSLGDSEIARILNMKKTNTPRGLPWTQNRVQDFRRKHHIPQCSVKPNRSLMTGQQAADYLGISRNGLLGLVRLGAINKNQVTDFAPWRILREDLDSKRVQSLVSFLKTNGRLPATADTSDKQLSLLEREE